MCPYVLTETLTFGLSVVMSDLPALQEIAGVDPAVTVGVDPEAPRTVARAIRRLLQAGGKDEVQWRASPSATRSSSPPRLARLPLAREVPA